ncbi:hydroxyphenylacetyl-CoA thioesterase PaaI [Dactylosporangium sp. NPDC048998]|uniref:hydroxyphenylacetyl-CoA thioesterase PaaI n=1 Tax=Dactylosporangium sp. NPDC048998 TaxID=3363976 RepID=UPI00371A8477
MTSSIDRVVQAHGIEVELVTPGRATARMKVTADMANLHGIAHGGYVFLLADTAFAYACNQGRIALAQAAQIVFLRPVPIGAELTAVAAERAAAGACGIYDVTVRTAGGEVVAEFRGQSAALPRQRGER